MISTGLSGHEVKIHICPFVCHAICKTSNSNCNSVVFATSIQIEELTRNVKGHSQLNPKLIVKIPSVIPDNDK